MNHNFKQFFLSASVLFCFTASSVEIPVGITIKSDNIVKNVLSNKKYSKVYKLQLIQPSFTEDPQLAVLTQPRIYYLSAKNHHQTQVVNAKPVENKKGYFGLTPELVDVDNDGQYEIMKGGSGYGQVALLDSKGYPLWSYQPGAMKPSKMISVDLNKDKAIEFYAINKSSLVQLDKSGHVIWEVLAPRYFIFRSNFNDIEFFHNHQTQNDELLVTANNVFYRYNHVGELLGKFKGELPVRNFQIVNWNQEQFILVGYFDDKVALLNFDGTLHQYINLKALVHYHEVQAINVKFHKNKPEYLAVLTHSSSSQGLSQLSIISPEYKVIYQELIKSTRGLISLPQTSGGGEVLVTTDNLKRLVEYKLD